MRKILSRYPDNKISCPDCRIRIDVRSPSFWNLRCPWCGGILDAGLAMTAPATGTGPLRI